MFEGVETGIEDGGGKRAAVSTGVSLMVYGVIGAVVVAVGGSLGAKAVAKKEPVRVSFKAPAPKLETPPPPPPPAATRTAAPKGKKRSTKPPSAPTIIDDGALAEGDEKDFRTSATADSLADIGAPIGGAGDGLGQLMANAAPPPPAPPPPGARPGATRRNAIFVADSGTRPVARPGNRAPVFPRNARKRGREGEVVLRFVVTIDGTVESIEVISGEEPFIAAAIAAVKRWRYAPAVVDGRPEDAYHRVRIPFRLKAA